MKKIIAFSIIGLLALSSCSFETYQCPAYGTKVKTKHGHKAQAKYYRNNKKRI